jgi:hypothetical protein
MNRLCSAVTVAVAGGNVEGVAAALSVSRLGRKSWRRADSCRCTATRDLCADAHRDGAGRSTRGVQ